MRVSTNRSIEDIDFSKVPDCDIMTGGFPCQDFSMIWKRGGLQTERGNLYTYFVKAVHIKKPKVFIGENVKEGADNKLICFLHPRSTYRALIELCQEKYL